MAAGSVPPSEPSCARKPAALVSLSPPQPAGYGYSVPGRAHTTDGAIASLLGILSVITGPVGIILGPLALYIGGGVGRQDDWGNIGCILGIIGAILGVVFVLILLVPLIFLFAFLRI